MENDKDESGKLVTEFQDKISEFNKSLLYTVFSGKMDIEHGILLTEITRLRVGIVLDTIIQRGRSEFSEPEFDAAKSRTASFLANDGKSVPEYEICKKLLEKEIDNSQS